jgi:hypothetical protein
MVAAISNDPLSSNVVEDPSARLKVNENDDDIVMPDVEEHSLLVVVANSLIIET